MSFNDTSNTLYEEAKIRSRRNPAGHKLALFIGNDAASLGGLMLESGYAGIASENPKGSQNLLIRLLYGHGLLADVIICDVEFRESEIRKLLEFIHGINEFSNIPFLMYAKTDDLEMKEKIRSIRGVDDVLFPQTSVEDICTKVDFLKKFKNLQTKVKKKEHVIMPSPGKSRIGLLGKRFFDILIASLLLVLLSPLFLLIAILIRLESRGPVLYKSLRAGKAYRIFNFYKFRTMEVGAEEKLRQLSHLNQYGYINEIQGPLFFKVSNDPRITKVGSFLRNTSLDELPQLINVLIGDMSLVGNRPLPLYEAVTLTTDQWAERFLAPAGITGLWQIRKRGHKDMSIHERINLDIDYAQKHSFLYDMWIMFNTPSALIQGDNV
ncbi:MAG TPA: sugar transferase [Chitinophagaceae bacterium]|nr:sugar transferase [Chitinophagaceae bacterium]